MTEIARYSITDEIPLFRGGKRTLSPEGGSFSYHNRFDIETTEGLVLPFAADTSVWAHRLTEEEAVESWQRIIIVSYAQWLHYYLGEDYVNHLDYSDREPAQKPYNISKNLQNILDSLGIVVRDGQTLYTGQDMELGKTEDGGFQLEVAVDYTRSVHNLMAKFVPVARI